MSGDTKILLPAVEIAQRTDPGRDPQKQINEDTSGYKETRFGHLCVVWVRQESCGLGEVWVLRFEDRIAR